MKIFLDSANLKDIENVHGRGLLGGITTNPTAIHGQTRESAVRHLEKIVGYLRRENLDIALHAQVMSRDTGEMVDQAQAIVDALDLKALAIKVPCTWENFTVIRKLSRSGIAVNCTAVVTADQAVMAAAAGARYVSLFASRMDDAGIDVCETIAKAAHSLNECGTEIIMGSVRPDHDVAAFGLAGAHITTLPVKLMENLAGHAKSEEIVDFFSEYFISV
jgi:transaldolase